MEHEHVSGAGAGYVLIQDGDIYKLSKDFRSPSKHIDNNMALGFEPPAFFFGKAPYQALRPFSPSGAAW